MASEDGCWRRSNPCFCVFNQVMAEKLMPEVVAQRGGAPEELGQVGAKGGDRGAGGAGGLDLIDFTMSSGKFIGK